MATALPLKIALVGPALPYRSGIAIHTSHIQQALTKAGANTEAFSFRRQYPQWLYPGNEAAPDITQEGKSGTRYTIDVYNPFSWLRTADAIVASGATVAILTWWTVFWQPGFFIIERRLRKRGVKTIYFCHNLFDHKTDGPMGLVNKSLSNMSRSIIKTANAYIVQSSAQRQQLLAIKPAARLMQRIHPIAQNPPPAVTRLPKRGRLELLFFGLIRPYKGLDILLAAAKQLDDHELYITIVGEVWGDVKAIQQQLDQSRIPNLETHLEYVDDQTAAQYFERADVVVLPYRAATGSAVVALAYAYGKPVIATEVIGLTDAVVAGQTGWLVAPESPEALAATIAGINRDATIALRTGVKAFRQQNSWPTMAQEIIDFTKHLTR